MNKGKPFALPSPFRFPPENTPFLSCGKRCFLKNLFSVSPLRNKIDSTFSARFGRLFPTKSFLFPLADNKKRRHQSNQRKNFCSFSVPAPIENTSLSQRLSLSENGRFYLRKDFSRCGVRIFPAFAAGFRSDVRTPFCFLSVSLPLSGAKTAVFAACLLNFPPVFLFPRLSGRARRPLSARISLSPRLRLRPSYFRLPPFFPFFVNHTKSTPSADSLLRNRLAFFCLFKFSAPFPLVQNPSFFREVPAPPLPRPFPSLQVFALSFA